MANELKPVPGTDIELYDQAVWNRSTVADGNRLQAETLVPISANDRILASAIQGAYDYTDECFNALSADFVEFQDEVDNEFQETYQYINNVSGDLYNDIRTTESNLSSMLQDEINNRIAQDADLTAQIEMTQTTLHNEIVGASADLQGEIDALEAATDVVDVVDTLVDLEQYDKKITKDDIIKILDASGTYDSSGLSAYDFSGEQVYVRYNGKTTAHPLSANWTYVGKLEPYYNTSYIDAMYNNIEASALNLYNTIDETSSTLNDNIDTASSTLNSKLNDVYAAKFSANTTAAGNIVNGFYISGGQGVTVTTADNNNNKGIYISAEGNKYVKYTDSALNIGDTSSLGVTGAATALGYQASAKNNSFAICLGNSDTVLDNRSFAVGFGNSGNNGSYIIGEGNDTTSTQSTHHFTIGINNKNTGENSYIIGSNNATNTDGLIILGHKASTTHIPSDILAVGNGNGGDCLLINPTAFKFKPGTAEIHLNEYGLYNNNTEKLYSWNEVLGLGEAVERGGTVLTASCSSTDQLLANNILIYGDVNDDTYAFYVSSATQTLTNYSHTFRLYPTVMSTYKLKISVPDTYDILLKCFSDNGWGFSAAGGTGTKSSTNIMHKKGSITNSYKPSDGSPYTNTYTTGNPLSLWYPHDNSGSAHYFYFQQLWGGQYIDVTVDSQTHTFIMRKGGGDV